MSTQLGSDGVYYPESNPTHGSLLMQPSNAHDWFHHAFHPTNLESSELLCHSYMATDLQYAAAHVALYFVATAGCRRYLGADLVEFATIKTKHNEIGEKVWLLDYEKRNFEERYVVLVGEEFYAEYQVTSLDREVDRLL